MQILHAFKIEYKQEYPCKRTSHCNELHFHDKFHDSRHQGCGVKKQKSFQSFHRIQKENISHLKLRLEQNEALKM